MKETQPWPPAPACREIMQRSWKGVMEYESAEGLRWDASTGFWRKLRVDGGGREGSGDGEEVVAKVVLWRRGMRGVVARTRRVRDCRGIWQKDG